MGTTRCCAPRGSVVGFSKEWANRHGPVAIRRNKGKASKHGAPIKTIEETYHETDMATMGIKYMCSIRLTNI